MKVHGRCHCGAIDCQMLTGSAFRANIAAPAERFRILTGDPRKYVKVADSGTRRVHAFCGTCGAPVYSAAPENPKAYSLRLGALQEKEALGRPARQIWTKRRLSWVAAVQGVPEMEGQP
jgi:hypothetical protein